MGETKHSADLPEELMRSRNEERHRSLLDLIEQKALDVGLAAWLISHVSKGASFITGAGPGGVGKTTTMRALLAFAPGDRPFSIALPGDISAVDGVPSCVVSHELSDHPPPAYIWGQDLRDFFALSQQDHMLVGNMHADDLAEVQSQIVEANDVPEAQFRAMNLFAFVRVEGADPSAGRIKDPVSRRYFNEIYYSDGTGPHACVFSCQEGLSASAPRDAAYADRCRQFLEAALADEVRPIETLRRRFLDWEKEQGS